MHAKALSIFNTIKANPNVTFAKKHSVEFFENVARTNPNNQQRAHQL
jgi:predicted SnoaL-like aldol condensation-catalyzing enzyme